MIFLTLPYPVSVNTMYCHTKRGVYLNPLAKKYKQDAFILIREQGFKTHFQAFEKDADLYMQVEVSFPKLKRKRDIDNLLKIIQDSLMFSGLIFDDSQICEINIKKLTKNHKCTKDGYVNIALCESDQHLE